MTEANVTPHQPWPQPGNADVVPEDTTTPVTLPVVARAPGAYTISRSEYPNGVVIVNPTFRSDPPDKTVRWELRSSSGPDETLGPGWGDGVVVLFQG